MARAETLNILVCLPTTSQTMKSATAVSIAKTCTFLTSLGHVIDLHNIDSAEIVTARDMFANMVLHSDRWDHLLFIDSDMRFEPPLIQRMIDIKTDLCAAAYVRRAIDLPTLVEIGRKTSDLGHATAMASAFTFKASWDDQVGPLEVRDGFCAGAAVGMGCALISKNTLRHMMDRDVVRVRHDLQAASGDKCWSFFEPIEMDGMRLGEDYSFCYRWTALLKRELLICVDTSIGHIGSFEYAARYLDTLKRI